MAASIARRNMKICESQSKFTGSAAAVDASFSSRRTGLYSRTDAGQTFRTSIKRIMAADSKKWIHLINDRKFHSVGSRTRCLQENVLQRYLLADFIRLVRFMQ